MLEVIIVGVSEDGGEGVLGGGIGTTAGLTKEVGLEVGLGGCREARKAEVKASHSACKARTVFRCEK